MVIWLVGLSGSGKTTIGNALVDRLRCKYPNTVFLDGDMIREAFSSDVDHSHSGRQRNHERMTALCQLLDNQGMNVVVAILSIFPDLRKGNRKKFSKYFEVFIDVPVSELEQRDPKGLYEKARAGLIKQVVGLDMPFPRPKHYDFRIDSKEQALGVEHCVDAILEKLPNGHLEARTPDK